MNRKSSCAARSFVSMPIDLGFGRSHDGLTVLERVCSRIMLLNVYRTRQGTAAGSIEQILTLKRSCRGEAYPRTINRVAVTVTVRYGIVESRRRLDVGPRD